MFSILTVCRNLRSLHHMTQLFQRCSCFCRRNDFEVWEDSQFNLERNQFSPPRMICTWDWCEWSCLHPQHSLGIYRKRTKFSVLAAGVAWEAGFVCRAYVGPEVQKDLQILVTFYVQLWSHFLWLVLHHFFELCLLPKQWLTSYTDCWTEEDGGLKQCPWAHPRCEGALVFPDSLWLRDVSPTTEQHLLTNPLKPCNRINCTIESSWAAAWVGGCSQELVNFQLHWELQSHWKN